MKDIYKDIEIETACKERFGVAVDITEIIARSIPVGVAAEATLFKVAGGQRFAYIASQSALVLDDVRKIIHRMQCEADYFFPPRGETEYFNRVAREKFKVMFPGKHITGDDDLRYYKNLASYNPALVRLAKINGEIRAFELHSKSWRKVKNYNFSKI